METGRRRSTLMTTTVSSEEDELSFVVEKLCSVLRLWFVCVCLITAEKQTSNFKTLWSHLFFTQIGFLCFPQSK